METTLTPTLDPFILLGMEPPSWLDASFTKALNDPSRDYPQVAYQAARMLSDEEVFAIQQIPLEAGGHLEGSRNILELAKYALFVEGLRFESEGRQHTFTAPAMSAVELMVRIVRSYGYSGFPLQDYMRLMGVDAIGRMGVHPKDRLAWSIVTHVLAMLPEGVLRRSNEQQLADNFTWLMIQAQQLLDEGPWNQAKESEIYEVASMLFVGSARPSAEVCAITTAEQEYVIDCNARASFPTLEEMVDVLGVDMARASALMDL